MRNCQGTDMRAVSGGGGGIVPHGGCSGGAGLDLIGRGRENPLMSNDTPVTPQDLLFCDQVYREPITGKTSLLGIFTHWNAPSIPERVPHVSVYLDFQGSGDSTTFRFRLLPSNRSEPPVERDVESVR